MGMSDTAGFVLHCVIYGLVWVLPTVGYGAHGYGCGVGKSDPWVSHFKPYLCLAQAFFDLEPMTSMSLDCLCHLPLALLEVSSTNQQHVPELLCHLPLVFLNLSLIWHNCPAHPLM